MYEKCFIKIYSQNLQTKKILLMLIVIGDLLEIN